MPDRKVLIEQLQKLWHDDFPLTRAMNIRVRAYAEHALVTHTTLQGNTNTHGTAFAGSLYTVQALTAWSLLHLELQSAGLEASIIHGRGQIDFHRTVEQDIVAQASMADLQEHISELAQTGKTRLDLTCEVTVDDEPASTFSGLYVVRLPR